MTDLRVVCVSRWFGGLFLAAGFLYVGSAQQQSTNTPPQPRSTERAVIDQYCVACHNDTTKTAGLALNTFSAENVNENTEIWEKVVRKLRVRYMPPPGLPRPDEKTYDAILATLGNALDRAAAAHPNRVERTRSGG